MHALQHDSSSTESPLTIVSAWTDPRTAQNGQASGTRTRTVAVASQDLATLTADAISDLRAQKVGFIFWSTRGC